MSGALAAARREAEGALALGHTDCVVCCHAVEQEALAEQKRLRGLTAPRRLAGYSDIHCDDCKAVVRLESALRALLAALPAEGEGKRTGPRCPFCESDRISRDPALDCWSCETCRRSWGEHPAPQTEPGAELTEPRLTAILSRVARGDSDYSDAQALAAELKRRHPGHDRIGELEALLRECNAVCLCGCPDSEHESYDEDGESCGDEEHVCIRVAPAVLAYVQDLRRRWADLGEDYEGLRARIDPPHPSWDTSCARCGRDLTVSSATCGECCAETPAAGVVEVTPAPPSPAGDAVREAAERLRASLVAVPSWEALLPKNCGACEGESDCAGEHEPCGCHETLAVIEASLALLAALDAARGGAS